MSFKNSPALTIEMLQYIVGIPRKERPYNASHNNKTEAAKLLAERICQNCPGFRDVTLKHKLLAIKLTDFLKLSKRLHQQFEQMKAQWTIEDNSKEYGIDDLTHPLVTQTEEGLALGKCKTPSAQLYHQETVQYHST